MRKIAPARYAEERTISGDQLRSDEPVAFSFDLPAAPELQSRLSDTSSMHWELLVSGKRPGFDYEKRFLLPAY